MDDLGKQMKAFVTKVEKSMQDLPLVIANESKNFFLDSFRQQGFSGEIQQPWKPRKKNKDPGRAILVKSGRLKRGIRIKRASWQSILISDDVPYAGVHNDGYKGIESVRASRRRIKSRNVKGSDRRTKVASGIGFVRAHQRKANIPRRRFMGNSPYLNARIERIITNRLKRL